MRGWRALNYMIIAFCAAALFAQIVRMKYGLEEEKEEVETTRGKSHYHYDVVVVGAGISGAVLAREHASIGHTVLVLEKRGHIGGNCYDYVDMNTGIRVNKYGAHLFHTNKEHVWEYVNRFAKWVPWSHRVLAWVKDYRGKYVYVPVPVNIQTVNKLEKGANIRNESEMLAWLNASQLKLTSEPKNSEEMAKSRVGNLMYEKIFGPYTQKQWNMSARDLGPEVTARIPVHVNFDDRYFDDKYQALPVLGYTSFFESLLDHQNIDVKLNTDYFTWGGEKPWKITYFTGPIDNFFNSTERLEYRSLRFKMEIMWNHAGYVLPSSVVNYPGLEFKHTRFVEYKQLLHQKSQHTLIVKEYSTQDGEPYYPIPTKRNKDLYASLVQRSYSIPNVSFVGRLANYKYFNMDEAVSNALSVFNASAANMSLPVIHVVTSIFKEKDVMKWMTSLCNYLPGKRIRWFVFDKGSAVAREDLSMVRGACISMGPIQHTNLPGNVGREGHSWLKYMQAGVFGTINVFLQGNPEAEIDKVAAMIDEFANYEDFYFNVVPANSLKCVHDEYFAYDVFLSQFQMLTSVINVSMDTMCYHYKGQFIASDVGLRKMNRKWSKVFADFLIPELETGNNPPIGHALERTWVTLFREAHNA